jgi:hypothetical protein
MRGARFPERAADDYLRHLNKVEGWLHGLSAEVILAISQFQRELGISGSVAEIGIHHGKLFFLLYLSTAEDETAVAIDVFDHQELNLDKSGHGDKSIFLRHAARFSRDLLGLSIVEDSSLNLTPRQLVQLGGSFRMFSIDGGHTEAATLNDLRLADAVLSESGVLVLDDYFNFAWPEVSVATARYLLSGETTLTPYAISPGKIFMCRPPMRDAYAALVARKFGYRLDKQARFFGCDVAVLARHPWTWKTRLGRTAFGHLLRTYRGRLVQAGAIFRRPWRDRPRGQIIP